jgi:IMP cyclohydrolase
METKFKNISNGKTADVVSFKAAGMCNKCIGITFVVFNYEEDNLDFPLIMEHIEFYRKHKKI